MAIQDGDILSALQDVKSNTSKISQTLSEMSEKDIHQIQKDLSALVRISQGTSRYEESARFQKERDERAKTRQSRGEAYFTKSDYRYQSQGTAKSEFSKKSAFRRENVRSSSRGKSAFDGVLDEFLASFSEGISKEFKKSLQDTPVHKQIKGHIKKFADDLGIEVSQIPSEFGKGLGKYVVQNTQFGKQVTSTLQSVQDKIFTSLSGRVKNSVVGYAKKSGVDLSSIYSEFVENFRADNKKSESQKQYENLDNSNVDVTTTAKNSSLDTVIALLENIELNTLNILNALSPDLTAINQDQVQKEVEESKKPQGESAKDYKDDSVQNSSQLVPEASKLQGEVKQKSDPDLFQDATTQIADKVQGVYRQLPDFVQSKISNKYGKYVEVAKNVLPNSTAKDPTMLQGIVSKAMPMVQGALSKHPALQGLASKALPSIASKVSGGALASVGSKSLMAAGGNSALTSAAGGLVSKAGMLGPKALIIALAAYVAMKKFSEAIGPAVAGVKQFAATTKKVSNRYWESQKQILKEEKKRIEADVKTMAETPFKIMNDAAQKWYDAWDNQLKTIGQTQGYTKADMQTLFSSYAERLRSENLSDAVSAADISSNLGSVLKAGLSGKIAEEFAYQATLLSNLIPTQDFFSYADTYAQVAGNAMAKGLDESSAIQEANRQLQQFASNLLYAGRNISNGIATGLKDGSQLFADAVKIANTAKTGDSTQISGVLTSVAAEISAIAPDLASDIVSNIVQAAVGGNNSDLVALRSMSGIGASNTAFIKALAENPQQVFATLFSNLSNMQKMNADNYLEVAESLSETFGISASAFARIDFGALSQAVSSMQVNQSALSENLELLKSGETTPGPEELRMRQINQMILDEGLAYVLDNEAAREIQQHMWDQELANEIMEREYSVDFAGSAKELIQGIAETVHNILKALNPFSWIGSLVNLVATKSEYDAQMSDLRSILESGKVGSGNATSFRNLTNYKGGSLDSVPSLMSMLGLKSQYESIHSSLNAFNSLTEGSGYGAIQFSSQLLGKIESQLQTALSAYSQSNINSKYSWGFVGKTIANAIANTPTSPGINLPVNVSSNDAIRKKQADNMNKLLSSMNEAVEANKSYEDWKSSVTSQYKISNFKEALSGVGLTEEDVKGQFEAKESQKVSKHKYDREKVEDEFWEKSIKYYDIQFPEFANSHLSKMDTQIDLQTQIRDELINFHTDSNSWWSVWVNTTWKKDWIETTWNKDWISNNWINKFLSHWTDIYVKFDTYSRSTNDAYKAIDKVKNDSKKKESGDAVLALAKALTDNTADLKDPTIQSNALLAQILIVVEAILQAENTSGGASLQTSLSALGLGLTTSDTSTT